MGAQAPPAAGLLTGKLRDSTVRSCWQVDGTARLALTLPALCIVSCLCLQGQARCWQ